MQSKPLKSVANSQIIFQSQRKKWAQTRSFNSTNVAHFSWGSNIANITKNPQIMQSKHCHKMVLLRHWTTYVNKRSISLSSSKEKNPAEWKHATNSSINTKWKCYWLAWIRIHGYPKSIPFDILFQYLMGFLRLFHIEIWQPKRSQPQNRWICCFEHTQKRGISRQAIQWCQQMLCIFGWTMTPTQVFECH